MRLQVRLTLWSVFVTAIIAIAVSAVDLTEEVNRQFDVNLKRSLSIRRLVHSAVQRSLDRHPAHYAVPRTIQEDEHLTDQLQELLTESALVEIAVCDPQNVILNGTDAEHIGKKLDEAPAPADFEELVRKTKWWSKLPVLLAGQKTYQVSDNLFENRQQVLSIHVLIDPGLIREDILPSLTTHAGVSLATIVGAMFAALIFSSIAYRPLGRVGQMLDLITQGEQESQQEGAPKADQFGLVANKVNRLGERLRGAQVEIADLRVNVERLLNEMEDVVFIFGRDRRLIAATGAVDRYLTRPRAELIGQLLTDIFPPSTSIGLLLGQSIQTGRPVRNRRVPLDIAPQTGAVPIALLSVEFLDASAASLLIRLRDPEATREIGRRLQTADRLSAISRLTGGVAHEVKNPLNAILMHVELAKMKLNHGDYDLAPQMDVISSEILRLDRVVKTFLDFTRPVVLNFNEMPLHTLVTDIVDLARPQAENCNIALSVEQSVEPVGVMVDADLLKQALLNIVVNAIEAMTEGGKLEIQSGVRSNYAEIRIVDSGPGIPPEVRDKIYNLYFTTKTHGSGIGLAMTYRIVQLHDGKIDFSSEPGKGTTFTVQLPLSVGVA